MSIQKKSLIANREAAKKAIVATKAEPTQVKSNQRVVSNAQVRSNQRVVSSAQVKGNVKVFSNARVHSNIRQA